MGRAQLVYLGRLASGQFGLFTNGMLACSVTPAEAGSMELLLALCDRMGFELIEREN